MYPYYRSVLGTVALVRVLPRVGESLWFAGGPPTAPEERRLPTHHEACDAEWQNREDKKNAKKSKKSKKNSSKTQISYWSVPLSSYFLRRFF